MLRLISELTTPITLLHAFKDNRELIQASCSKFFINRLCKITQDSLKSRLIFKGSELDSGLLLEYQEYFSQFSDPAHLSSVERFTLLLTIRLIRTLLVNTTSPALAVSFRSTRASIFKQLCPSSDWSASELIFLIAELAFCFQNFHGPLKQLETLVYAQDYSLLKGLVSQSDAFSLLYAANENLHKSPALNQSLFFLLPRLANLVSGLCSLLDNLDLDHMIKLLSLTAHLHLETFSASLKVDSPEHRFPSSFLSSTEH